jgi:hypothetical protein
LILAHFRPFLKSYPQVVTLLLNRQLLCRLRGYYTRQRSIL